MLEETAKATIGQAAQTISQSVWGALLLLSWAIFGIVFYFTVSYLTKQLQSEREAHQLTREARLSELKSNNQMATGLLTIQDEQKAMREEQSRQTGLLINALTTFGRPV